MRDCGLQAARLAKVAEGALAAQAVVRGPGAGSGGSKEALGVDEEEPRAVEEAQDRAGADEDPIAR